MENGNGSLKEMGIAMALLPVLSTYKPMHHAMYNQLKLIVMVTTVYQLNMQWLFTDSEELDNNGMTMG